MSAPRQVFVKWARGDCGIDEHGEERCTIKVRFALLPADIPKRALEDALEDADTRSFIMTMHADANGEANIEAFPFKTVELSFLCADYDTESEEAPR